MHCTTALTLLLALAASSVTSLSSARTLYTIAGVDTQGVGSFQTRWSPTFEKYLNSVVGTQFNPPVRFQIRTMAARDIVSAVATGSVDYAYLNPVLASCAIAESEGVSNAILTLDRQNADGQDVDRNGGVIFARADSGINSLDDLVDKRVSATSVDDLFGFQAQVNELQDFGITFDQHVAQVVFTSSWRSIVQDVLAGHTDVGFLEDGQLEEAEEEGLASLSDLIIIHPITEHELLNGAPFPYAVSTPLYPTGAIVMHTQVETRVQKLVGEALLALNKTHVATIHGRYSGWRPAANYIEVIKTMEVTGFLDASTDQCIRTGSYRDNVICDNQFKVKSQAEFDTSCHDNKLPCPADANGTEYSCSCTPCEPACGKNQFELSPGACECNNGFVPVGSSCAPLAALIVGVLLPSLLALAGLVRYAMKWQMRRADALWHIKPHELEFDDPAVCLGAGSFGVVVQAEYRGSIVALKSILPAGARRGAATTTGGTVGANRSRAAANVGHHVRSKDTAQYRRTQGQGLFFSGYEHVLDAKKRGLLQLKRALRQAADTVVAEAKSVANGTASTKVVAAAAASQVSRGAASLVSAGSHGGTKARSSVRRTLSTLFTSRARREREEFTKEMRLLSKLRHPCVATVIGAVLEPDCPPVLVMEFMDLGSLHSLLHNNTMSVDDETMRMMMLDIVRGCRFLHAADPPVVHGDLKAMNVLVDSRFRAKVADFGLSQRHKTCAGTPYWMAPELLKGAPNSTASDVYAFGVVLYEMVTRQNPYEGEEHQEVLRDVVKNKKRPQLPRGLPAEFSTIMHECWHWDARRRPTFLELERRMSHFDSLCVAERNLKRNQGNNVVLDQVFPAHVARALAEGKKLDPERYDCVTIFFSDIVGFTDISKTLPPEKVCDMLDWLYTRFDILSDKHDIFKVETIGDAYMAVANLHKPQQNHADRIARFSLDAVKAARATLVDETDPQRGGINLRVGFHAGSVVANVVGTKNPRYCLFGDTVNTASRMESSSEANRIHLSSAAHDELVKEKTKLSCTSRGVVDIKGKGCMETFWLDDTAGSGCATDDMSEKSMKEEVERRRSSRTVAFNVAASGRTSLSLSARDARQSLQRSAAGQRRRSLSVAPDSPLTKAGHFTNELEPGFPELSDEYDSETENTVSELPTADKGSMQHAETKMPDTARCHVLEGASELLTAVVVV